MHRARFLTPALLCLLAPLFGATPAGASSHCTITAQARQLVVRGTQHADVICARSGRHIVYALGGDDTVYTGSGSDVVYGRPG